MKIAVALVVLAAVLSLVPTTEGWRARKTADRVGRGAGRKGRRAVDSTVRALRKKNLSKMPLPLKKEMSDDEFLTALSTRDISDLLDVSQLTDAELNDLYAIKRETSELMNKLDAED